MSSPTFRVGDVLASPGGGSTFLHKVKLLLVQAVVGYLNAKLQPDCYKYSTGEIVAKTVAAITSRDPKKVEAQKNEFDTENNRGNFAISSKGSSTTGGGGTTKKPPKKKPAAKGKPGQR